MKKDFVTRLEEQLELDNKYFKTMSEHPWGEITIPVSQENMEFLKFLNRYSPHPMSIYINRLISNTRKYINGTYPEKEEK